MFCFWNHSGENCTIIHILQVFAQVPTSQPKLITWFSIAAKLYGTPRLCSALFFFIALTHFQILCIIFFFILLYAFPSSRVFLSGFSSVQFSSVAQLCPTLCYPMNRSTPGLLVHHQLPEFTQIHAHRVGDAIQPSHPLSSPSLPAPNPSQHQSLFQWVNSSHEVAKYWSFSFSIILSKEIPGLFQGKNF